MAFHVRKMFLFARCLHLLAGFANGGVKISIKFFSTDVVFFPVHPAVLKYEAKIDLLVF